MPDDRRQDAAPAADAPKMIEVQLVRRYCPHWFVNEDGSLVHQPADSEEIMKTVSPGLMKLHADDAAIALRTGAALPTSNTFKGM